VTFLGSEPHQGKFQGQNKNPSSGKVFSTRHRLAREALAGGRVKGIGGEVGAQPTCQWVKKGGGERETCTPTMSPTCSGLGNL